MCQQLSQGLSMLASKSEEEAQSPPPAHSDPSPFSAFGKSGSSTPPTDPLPRRQVDSTASLLGRQVPAYRPRPQQANATGAALSRRPDAGSERPLAS